MDNDCIIEVRFLTTAEGGRKTALNSLEYRIAIVLGEKAFEARVYPTEANLPIKPGESLIAPVRFLSPELVRPLLRKGQKIDIYEGKVVARGHIID